MPDEPWQEAGEAALKLGRGHLAHGRFADALVALAEAQALLPDMPEIHRDRAEAYLGRWRAEGDDADKEAAGTHARTELDRDPGWSRGYELLNALDAPPVASARRPRWVYLAGATLGVLAVVGVLVALASKPGRAPDMRVSVPVAASQRSAVAPADLEVPLSLQPGPQAEGLTMRVRRSRVSHYPTSTYWRGNASLVNGSGTEITGLRGRVELVDGSGAVVQTWKETVLGFGRPSMRPRDHAPLFTVRACPPDVVGARLVLEARDDVPAPKAYGLSRPLTPRWVAAKPPSVALAIRERSFAPSAAGGNAVVELEIENQGAWLSSLVLAFEAIDRSGQPIVALERRVATADATALVPGELRVVKWYVTLPPTFDHFGVAVIEAR